MLDRARAHHTILKSVVIAIIIIIIIIVEIVRGPFLIPSVCVPKTFIYQPSDDPVIYLSHSGVTKVVIRLRCLTAVGPDLLDSRDDRRGVHLPVRIWRLNSVMVDKLRPEVVAIADQPHMGDCRLILLLVS